jgi:phosphoesterase RecJ-like protein
MSDNLDARAAAELLRGQDNILIIMHKNPDGDTLSCGYALCRALRAMGKKADARCDSPIPRRYSYITEPSAREDFAPGFVVAVDVADANLIGERFRGVEVDLCIDHHASNTGFAGELCLYPESASCAEVIARVIDELGVDIDLYMARCLYTGVATDTGCFRYSNTTSDSLRMAARMIDIGIDCAELNRELFEVKTRERIELEQIAMAGMEYAYGGRIAIMTISQDMLRLTKVDASDTEGLTSMPRNINGVEAGVTLRELKNGNFKISLRTVTLDAAEICAVFGGGGHRRAAGFECSGSQFDIKVALVRTLESAMGRASA